MQLCIYVVIVRESGCKFWIIWILGLGKVSIFCDLDDVFWDIFVLVLQVQSVYEGVETGHGGLPRLRRWVYWRGWAAPAVSSPLRFQTEPRSLYSQRWPQFQTGLLLSAMTSLYSSSDGGDVLLLGRRRQKRHQVSPFLPSATTVIPLTTFHHHSSHTRPQHWSLSPSSFPPFSVLLPLGCWGWLDMGASIWMGWVWIC